MPLWGNTTSDESKPKYLTDAEKKKTFADQRGWVFTQPDGTEEVLVAIGSLAGVSAITGLGAATISSFEFVTTSISAAAGGNIDIRIVYNEKVTVDTSGGTPTITVTNSTAGGGTDATFTAAYQSGSSTNRLVFRATYGAADGGIAENDVLSLAAQDITLNSGTITDTADGTTSAEVAISADVASGGGTLTVSA